MKKTIEQQEQDRIFFERVVGVALLFWFLTVSAVGAIGIIAKILG